MPVGFLTSDQRGRHDRFTGGSKVQTTDWPGWSAVLRCCGAAALRFALQVAETGCDDLHSSEFERLKVPGAVALVGR